MLPENIMPYQILPLKAIKTLPPLILAYLNDHLKKLAPEDIAALTAHPHFMRFLNLLSVSDWAVHWLLNDVNMLKTALLEGQFDQPVDEARIKDIIFASLNHAVSFDQEAENGLMQAFRNIRKLHILHIAYRDINKLDSLEVVLNNLSLLASNLIDATVTFCYELLAKKHGTPRDNEGLIVHPIVLGMGKLGGQELNFSSDVDLMFAYRKNGETDGHYSIENQLFFNKMVQHVVKILETPTVDGFVYRVDLRLRPFGDSGSLAMSMAGFEDYYLRHGRDWERYALIKARPIAGNTDDGTLLLAELRPFVYRKYIDFATIDALRDMKAMIAHEVVKKKLQRNIKLGPGGIREIEFIGQSFQLIYGGREIQLRTRQIIPTLQHLQLTQRLTGSTVAALLKAYTFMRQVENRLQLKNDQQTHDLPYDKYDKLQISNAMGYATWPHFVNDLLVHVDNVKFVFNSIFGDIIEEGETAGFVHEFNSIWRQQSKEALKEWLEQQAFLEPNDLEQTPAYEILTNTLMDFYQNTVIKSSLASQKQLEKLIPLALITLEKENISRALPLFLGLIETIHRRTTYLALLTENPQALAQLLHLSSQSPWIMRYLAKYPILLDELLAPADKRIPLRRSGLNKELRRMLSQIEPHDMERKLEALRDFHHAHILKVAMADISGRMPLMIVSDHLSEIAEVILNKVLKLAWTDVSARYGEPMFFDQGQIHSAEFAMIAYGKLGGLELGYGSDLDIVFLHNSRGSNQVTNGDATMTLSIHGNKNKQNSIENSLFFMKLAQKIIYYLTTQTLSGVLYEVDTRLRPSGHSGLLVSSIDNFIKYQTNDAWTWEHQALIRARFIAGSRSLGKQFSEIRRTILTQKRTLSVLKTDVLNMRQKMRDQNDIADKKALTPSLHSMPPSKNNTIKIQQVSQIKASAGGIIDIEFIVQYLVLAHSYHADILIKFTDNIRQLAGLEATGIITSVQAMVLRDTYRELRAHSNRAKLKEVMHIENNAVLQAKINHVIEIWQEIFNT